MQTRSTRSSVVFRHPFVLNGFDDELRAGVYEVITEEELLQGLSFEAYRCVAIHLKVEDAVAGRIELRLTTAGELAAAQARDRADRS
jgi:hypothetical protein